MRKLIGVAVLLCVVSVLGMAQETPLPEVYGGYQFTSTDGGCMRAAEMEPRTSYVTRWLAEPRTSAASINRGLTRTLIRLVLWVTTHRGSMAPFAHACSVARTPEWHRQRQRDGDNVRWRT
jgi:hypothetical protein